MHRVEAEPAKAQPKAQTPDEALYTEMGRLDQERAVQSLGADLRMTAGRWQALMADYVHPVAARAGRDLETALAAFHQARGWPDDRDTYFVDVMTYCGNTSPRAIAQDLACAAGQLAHRAVKILAMDSQSELLTDWAKVASALNSAALHADRFQATLS